MFKMYSPDLRSRAVHSYQVLRSLRKCALVFGIGHSTLARWITELNHQHSYSPRHCKAETVINFIMQCVKSNPFLSTRSLARHIFDNLHIDVSHELVRTALTKSKMTRKKARFYSTSSRKEQDTCRFLQLRAEHISAGRPFVSMDETSFGRHVSPSYGWSPKGRPLCIQRRNPHITTVSVLAAVTQTGKIYSNQRQGSYNRESFLEALRGFKFAPGTVIMLDNVAFHHSKRVKEYAEQHGLHLLYTPPYSPWFNPIENVFSIMKRHFYKYGHILEAIASVTSQHIKAFFSKALSVSSGPDLISAHKLMLCSGLRQENI